MPTKKTLLIDNYDSFTFNLYQYLGELHANPIVKRNDELTIAEIEKMKPTHIVLSPGPGRPDDVAYFGVCLEVILNLSEKIPVLGVCLGHQGIAHAFGGKVIRAPQVMHGKTSVITHTGKGIFRNLPNPIEGMRYHSLVAEEKSFPAMLEITAREKESGLIMGLQHRNRKLFGIQFHPESIGTPNGKQILTNFLES
ncbi:MAG: aminodeoxychorismate/anthranilate synthase component II [Candidatus Gracilibacteria bacterium]|nr:aminodeoxychorismate/anthranilate synthase component II [Candidatus Gracilibacteria bacterium]MDD5178916.1 aminodeoxychorismate/anthranilate synthase component II [Candidatus Gracilibacteria bacterium]